MVTLQDLIQRQKSKNHIFMRFDANSEWNGWTSKFLKRSCKILQVKVVNVEQERQVMEDVIRTLDRHENENLPQVRLGTTEVMWQNLGLLMC